jgi:hypothetical protein
MGEAIGNVAAVCAVASLAVATAADAEAAAAIGSAINLAVGLMALLVHPGDWTAVVRLASLNWAHLELPGVAVVGAIGAVSNDAGVEMGAVTIEAGDRERVKGCEAVVACSDRSAKLANLELVGCGATGAVRKLGNDGDEGWEKLLV